MISKNFQINKDIALNETERNIFKIIRDFLADAKLETTVRVAGGWVRDKVIGLESCDIDFAIDDMKGEDFVKAMNDYLKEKTQVESRGFGVTRFNPEKSKHLETAKVKIMDTWIDVVNLRGEIYNQNSRIPQIVNGTPEQDAYRRDLTINALFYNLKTSEVEDLTQKGLEDLANGIARTPLPAKTTFMDDPLRILRVIRFTGRFGLTMEKEITDSFSDTEILNGLKTKVSKERVGIELRSMLQHPSVLKSFEFFQEFKMLPYIFEIPPNCADLINNSQLVQELFDNAFKHVQAFHKFGVESEDSICRTKILSKALDKKEIRMLSFLSHSLITLRGYKCDLKNKKKEDLVSAIIKDSIKFPNKEAEVCDAAIESYLNFQKLAEESLTGRKLDVDIAKTIRELGQYWELAFNLSVTSELLQDSNKAEEILSKYNKMYDYIIEKNLGTVYQLKPLIDGGEIMKVLELKGGGPLIKKVQDKILYIQVENPKITKEDLICMITTNKKEFTD